MKQFVPVRIDITPLRARCESDLAYLGFDPSLIVCHVAKNLFTGHTHACSEIEKLIGSVNYHGNKDHIELCIECLSQELLHRLTCNLPYVSLSTVKIVLVTDGIMDCIAYVELNEYSKPFIPPQYQNSTIDEIALNYLGRQYTG